MRHEYRLFSSARIADLTVKNRLIRSATYEGAMTENGGVTPEILNLYRTLAQGGVGTIITGHMAVQHEGKGGERQICIYDDHHIKEISQIAEVVHTSAADCKIVAQLTHAGRQVLSDNTVAECVSPSDVPSPILKNRAKVLSEEEIRKIVEAFSNAIVRVKRAGYDGVQLHGAHGYLLSSFLSPYTNRREDEYGGSIEKRVAIIKEIIGKAKADVGNFPILIKMNCTDHIEGGIDEGDFLQTAKALEDLGIDAVEISGGMWDCLDRSEAELGFYPLPIPESRTRINLPEKQSYFVDRAEGLNLNIPVIVVGGHRNVERLEDIMRRGKIDFLAFSRPLICEPDLPIRWLEGRGSEKTKCVSCNSCLWELKTTPITCILKQSRLKQKMMKSFSPYIWKKFFH